MRLAIKLADERRAAAKGALNQLLEDPVLTSQGTSAPNEDDHKEQEALKEQIKAKEVQNDMLAHIFLQKEKELQAKIMDLQVKLDVANRIFNHKMQRSVYSSPKNLSTQNKDWDWVWKIHPLRKSLN